jgi:hypothetical protein
MTSFNELRNPDLSTGDVIHSSGYASAASGDSIGSSADGVSMEQRRQLMHSRKIVRSYAESHLGRRHGAIRPRMADESHTQFHPVRPDGGMRPRTADEANEIRSRRAYDESAGAYTDNVGYSSRNRSRKDIVVKQRNHVQIEKLPIEQRRHFIEPPTRNYNPFG